MNDNTIGTARQSRLNRIRRGDVRPRSHCPEEMRAYQEGKSARRALGVAMGGVFMLMVMNHVLNQERPPAVNGEALATVVGMK